MSCFAMVGNVFGPKYGNAIITKSLEPISFNGIDTISLDIAGEGLLFPNPSKKDDPKSVAKTISLTGSEGSGVGPAKYKMTSHDAVIDSNAWTHQSTCTLHGVIDAKDFSVGYEGPLFAQVTGPGHTSRKVQVGIMVPQPEFGVPIIEESLAGISFTGNRMSNNISFNITGAWLVFQDPLKKDHRGCADKTVKTISVTGAEGSGVWKFGTSGFGGGSEWSTLNGHVDPEFHVGYEGPLFAQVTGPGPASSKVQVGILMTPKNYDAYVVKKQLTAQFNQMDSKQDGFLTRAGIEELMGGAEKFAEARATYACMKKKYEAGDPNVQMQGGPAGLKFMDAVLQLDGDDRASLADLLRVCELA